MRIQLPGAALSQKENGVFWGANASKLTQLQQYPNPFPVACQQREIIPVAMENGDISAV